MADLRALLPVGRRITAQLAQGPLYRGAVRRVSDGWLLLEADQGQLLINLDHVAVITPEALGGDEPLVDEALPKPTSADRPVRASRAPGRPWNDTDLRELAEGFLDGHQDAELAPRFNRTKGQLKELRQGFECARGNLVEDQISPVARTWVERWRRVLTER